jgi:hypothetical protein
MVFLGLGNNLIAHGSRSSSPHSTARSNTTQIRRTFVHGVDAELQIAEFG